MAVTVVGGARHKLSPVAIAQLEERIAPAGGLEGEKWRVRRMRTGYTHANFKIMLVFLELQRAEHGDVGRRIYAALHPQSNAVIGLRGLRELPEKCVLMRGEVGSTHFQTGAACRGMGIGKTISSHAILHALKKGKPAYFEGISNAEWKESLEKLGVQTIPEGGKGVHFKGIITPEIAGQLPARESYCNYLLRRKPRKKPGNPAH